ncbi:hypothetical protein [Antrihabitans cavernicola]|uniref:Uncharacterized protein n=1 Tax=Antrihabitans cavernicola TaxID=2495913 RepID=A0A5A7S9E3_9NOCA|nr:hypothetical protein [Spelaeibacter cavernicola]KAA0021155.1 hypothetical protein FOY51_19755 [Spelaeibacter cavernicola]
MKKQIIAGPPMPSIPVLGTTWYRRGFSYWVRRAGVSLFAVAWFALFVFFITEFLDGFTSEMGARGRAITLTLAGCAIAWSFFTAIRAQIRQKRARESGRTLALGDANKPEKGARALGFGSGTAAYGGSPIAAGLLMLGALFAIGWFGVLMVATFRRHLGPEEIAAVKAVAEWKKRHPEAS